MKANQHETGHESLAEMVLEQVRRAGAEYGDIRVVERRMQILQGEDRRIARVQEHQDQGFGVRILYQGAWGFAASSTLWAPQEIRRVTGLAVEMAKAAAHLRENPVRLVPEPVHRDQVATSFQIDPFAVSVEEKAHLLMTVMEALHREPAIRRSKAHVWACRERKLFASTEGSHITFDLLAVQGGMEATAVESHGFASRRYATPHLRTGYELIQQAGFLTQASRVAAEAREKALAPPVIPGVYDLILDPEHLSLTIHETCGHPSELDRALGYEANYAGISFLTPEKLGCFRYGSRHVNLVADNTEPETLAATGYDDDGVACQRWDIVREGVFVGYCTNREVAGHIGDTRSRGSNRADGWKHMPMVRIANIGLEPGEARLPEMIAEVERGIYIEGHGSYSIDQYRYNFQFGGDACWLIDHGKRVHMLRDVVYQGITPNFWASCDAVADVTHRQRFGFITCGKGQPGQAGWMTHPAAHARFRGIHVLRARSCS